jgi:5-methylcytosine-specific restriction endonuclease McrA
MARLDRKGAHRANYERNKKRILATENTCGICGHPVDFSLKVPHPMSATIDHIIPVAKNGHPSDIDNLQLAHWTCNRQKSDKIFKQGHETKQQVIGNRNLPQSLDWKRYNSNNKQLEQQEKKKSTVIKVKRRVKSTKGVNE